MRLLAIIATLLAYILVFLATLIHPADLDLGWHLRFGKDVLENGKVIYENTYSTEMVGYHWFNSSWLLDVGRYLFWEKTGFLGMAILGSLVAVLTYWVISKTFSLSLFEKAVLFPLLLYVEHPLYIHSFRAQTLSLLGIMIVYWFLITYKKNHTKKIYLLIPFFLLWANIHAQFVLGITVFAVWAFVFLFQNIQKGIKKHLLPLCGTLAASFLVTLINPYGFEVYSESFGHSENPAIQFILEFSKPPLFTEIWNNWLIWGILMAISLIIIWRKKQLNEYAPFIVICLPLYIICFWMTRYHWPMYILTLPIIAVLIKSVQPKNVRVQMIIAYCILFISLGFVCVKVLPYNYLDRMNWNTYCEFNQCSPKGATVLSQMKTPGRIYTDYNYGGWLIWNYQDIKPSVDGRMPLWKDETGYSAFIRYIMLENNRNYVDLSPFDTYFLRNTRPLNNQLQALVDQKKWKLVFRDKFASIYTRLK